MELKVAKNAIEKILDERNIKNYMLEESKVSSKGENYLGDIRRIKCLTKKDNGDVERLVSLIVKLAPSWLEGMPVNLFYSREIFAYTQVLPEFVKLQNDFEISAKEKIHFAKFCDGSDKEKCEYLIMEDLCAEGFIMHDKKKPLNFDQVSLIFDHLAKFHAMSFALKKRSPETYARLEALVAEELHFGDISDTTMKNMSTNLILAVKDPEHKKRLELFMEHMKEMYFWYVGAATAAPHNVFTHGDCWSNNMLFKYENGKPTEMRLIDWQLLRLSSPVTDLLYAVYIGTERQLRTQHLSTLLENYYNTLSNFMKGMGCDPDEFYSRNIFKQHQKMLMRYGLAAALVNLPTLIVDEDASTGIQDEDFNFETLFAQPLTKACAERVDEVVSEFFEGGFLSYEEIASKATQTASSPNKLS